MFAGFAKVIISRGTREILFVRILLLLIFLIILSNISVLEAQDSSLIITHPVDGLSVESGLRYLAIKDEYISREKYSGSTSFLALDWTKYHETYYFHLDMDLINNAKIKNYNVTSYESEFDLNLSYLYPIGALTVLNRKAHFYLGPMAEFFDHYGYQNIAMLSPSRTLLISAGIRIDMLYPIGRRWDIESHMQSTIISIDQGESSDASTGITTSQGTIITLLSGLRYSFSAQVRYLLIKNISIRAGYLYNLVRSTAWDYFISSSDNLTASLTYSF